MPQMGEQRTVGTETRVWNGAGWAKPTPGSIENEPDTWLGGAARHFIEQEPAARNALLGGAALLTGGMGAPVAAAAQAATPLIGRGMKMLSQLLNTGHADRPTGGELAGDAIEGAVQGYGGQALGAAGRAAGRVGTAAREAASEFGPAASAIDKLMNWKTRLLTSRPVTSTMEALGTKLTPEGIHDSFGEVARGLKPGIEEVRPPRRTYYPKAKPASEYGVPSESPIASQGPSAPSRAKQPYTMPEAPPSPAGPAPRLAGKAPTLEGSLDDALQGLRGEANPTVTGKVGNTAQAPHVPRTGDIYGGDVPPPAVAAPAPGPAPVRPSPMNAEAQAHNIERNAPYGGGQLMPESLPSELRDPALEGLRNATGNVYHSELGMSLPEVPEFTFEGGNLAHPEVPGLTVDTSEFARKPSMPEFTFEGGNTAHPEVPGLTVDTSPYARAAQGLKEAAAPEQELPESWKQFAGGSKPPVGDVPVEHSAADLIGPQAETPFDDVLNELRMQGEAEGWPEYNPKWTSYTKAKDRHLYPRTAKDIFGEE